MSEPKFRLDDLVTPVAGLEQVRSDLLAKHGDKCQVVAVQRFGCLRDGAISYQVRTPDGWAEFFHEEQVEPIIGLRSTLPTKPGLWWFRPKDRPDEIPRVARVEENEFWDEEVMDRKQELGDWRVYWIGSDIDYYLREILQNCICLGPVNPTPLPMPTLP